MSRWVYVVLHLLFEGQAARRDAHVRFLLAQVDILRARLGGTRVIPSPSDRARLLAIGKELGHDVKDIVGIVKPEIYRRWIRQQEAGTKPKPAGRPRISTVRAREPRLGLSPDRWRTAQAPSSRWPLQHSAHPARGRATASPGECAPHACDRNALAKVPALAYEHTGGGRRFVAGLAGTGIHLQSRRVFMCPATHHPNRPWMLQQARNVQMWMEDEKIEPRFLLRDRDAKFALAFNVLFNDAGIRIVKAPVQAPNANAFVESWIGSLKRECLDHFTCFSRKHLDHILREYVRFYNKYRPHQGLGNRTLTAALDVDPPPIAPTEADPIRCKRFLGRILRHCYRAATWGSVASHLHFSFPTTLR